MANFMSVHLQAKVTDGNDLGTSRTQMQQSQAAKLIERLKEEVHQLSSCLLAELQGTQQAASEAQQVSVLLYASKLMPHESSFMPHTSCLNHNCCHCIQKPYCPVAAEATQLATGISNQVALHSSEYHQPDHARPLPPLLYH